MSRATLTATLGYGSEPYIQPTDDTYTEDQGISTDSMFTFNTKQRTPQKDYSTMILHRLKESTGYE